MKLTSEQIQAKESLLAFFLDNRPEIILQGHAGTGKTTLIKEVLKDYKELMSNSDFLDLKLKKPVLLASTHKACEQLSLAVGEKVKTIHKHFRVGIDEKSHLSHDEGKLYIIDEASYINDNLLNILRKFKKSKFLFIGDERQLTPVGSNYSAVFYADIPTITLTQVIRQNKALDIKDYCDALRDVIRDGTAIPIPKDSANIFKLTREEFNTTILNVTDNTCLLCFKNSTVNQYIKHILKNRFNSKSIPVGSLAINYGEYSNGLNNNQTVRITASKQTVLADCKGYSYSLEGLHNVFVPNTKADLNRLIKANLHYEYHIADLKPAWACTVHKAQGSTYSQVFIDLDDFKHTHDMESLRRLMYVAFSRASSTIYYTGEL